LAKAAGAEKAAEDARYYRAYAYYLNGDYANALHDCLACPLKPEKYELLGTIYLAMSKYEESARYFAKALRWYNDANKMPNPGLLDSYREARKRLNSV
jgi:TolA-binding protein